MNKDFNERLSGRNINWFKHFKDLKNHKFKASSSLSLKYCIKTNKLTLKDVINLLYLQFRDLSKEKGNDIVLIEEENNSIIIISVFQILDIENVECYTTPFINSEIFSISLNDKFVKLTSNLLILDDYPAYELVIKKNFSEEELKIKISKLIEKIDPKILNDLNYYLNEFKNKQSTSIIKSPIESPRLIGPPPGFDEKVHLIVFQFLDL